MTGVPTQFLYSAIMVEANFVGLDGTAHNRKGTGFLVSRSGAHYLVTNRHVLDASWDKPNQNTNGSRYRNFALQNIYCQGRASGDALREFRISEPPTFSDTYNEDVAVVKFTIAYTRDGRGNLQVSNYFSFDDLVEDTGFGTEILACDQVAFPCYGEGHSESDTRPIFRMGWIISDPTADLDYEHVKGRVFLVEGFSTNGASGAPVLALPVGIQIGPMLTMTGGRGHRPLRIAGVNAGHLLSPDFRHAHVSYAFKASIIRELITKAG